MKQLKIGCLMVLSWALLGCNDASNELESVPQKSQAVVEPADDMEALGMEIRRMIKTPKADTPEQCKIVGMGRKPCGGPERYLLYSEKTMSSDDVALFLEKLNRYNELARRFNEKSGRISDCSIKVKPTTVVRNGFCVPAEENTM